MCRQPARFATSERLPCTPGNSRGCCILRIATLGRDSFPCRIWCRTRWSLLKPSGQACCIGLPIADNTTKNDEYLPTPISQELVRILRERFHNGPVFFPTNFRKAFRAACVKVGLGLKTGFQEWQYEGLVRYDRRRSIIRMQELMIPSP